MAFIVLTTASNGWLQIQEVCSTTIHAMYINFTEGFDVALLKLAAPSEKVPVDLLFSDLPDRQEVKSLGWSPKKTSDRLQDFSLTALNNTQCGDSFRESCKCEVNIKDNMICAQTAQKDQCSGELQGQIGPKSNTSSWTDCQLSLLFSF